MHTMSSNWKSEMLSSGNAGDDSLYSSSAYQDIEQEELTNHIAEKKTRQIAKMVGAMVILFIAAITIYAVYKIYTSI